jgi:hypothetical protein
MHCDTNKSKQTSISETPKVFLPASGSFRGSEKLPDVRKKAFGIQKSFPTSGKILSGFRKAFRRQEKYFRGSEKLPDIRKNTFGIQKSFPTSGKILSGFRKFFPTQGKILSGFRMD